jgi:AcrR family transcriptional regulator
MDQTDGIEETREASAGARERIVAVAAEKLANGGREGRTTGAVATVAGVPRPTIYRLFGDKDGLLAAVAEHGFLTYLKQKRPSSRARIRSTPCGRGTCVSALGWRSRPFSRSCMATRALERWRPLPPRRSRCSSSGCKRWPRRVGFTAQGSQLASSMYRDLVRGRSIESEAIVGDLLHRGVAAGLRTPLLSAAHTHLTVYQNARREAAPIGG